MPILYSDLFARASTVGSLGPNYVLMPNGGELPNIVPNNQVGVQTITSRDYALYIAGQPPNDQYARLTITSLPTGTSGQCLIAVRAANPSASRNYYMYGCDVANWGGANTVGRMAREVVNIVTQIGGNGPTPLAAGQKIYLEAKGTTITARNTVVGDPEGAGIELSGTDANLSSGYAGFLLQNDTVGVGIVGTLVIGQLASVSGPAETPYSVARLSQQFELEAAS